MDKMNNQNEDLKGFYVHIQEIVATLATQPYYFGYKHYGVKLCYNTYTTKRDHHLRYKSILFDIFVGEGDTKHEMHIHVWDEKDEEAQRIVEELTPLVLDIRTELKKRLYG